MTVKNPKGPPKEWHFKPGQSGNPGGKSKHFLTRHKVKLLIDKFLALSKIELETLIMAAGTPALELMIASTILSCIKIGDYSRLEALLARAVGKVKENIEDDTESKSDVSRLSMGDLLSLVKPISKE